MLVLARLALVSTSVSYVHLYRPLTPLRVPLRFSPLTPMTTRLHESGEGKPPGSQQLGERQPRPPDVPRGVSRAGWSQRTRPGKPFPDRHLTCPASRLLANWVLSPKTPFPHLTFYFEVGDSPGDEKPAQRSPTAPSPSFPGG